MTLKDLLKPKREKLHADSEDEAHEEPEFTFMRTDTHTEELLDVSNDTVPAPQHDNPSEHGSTQQSSKRFSRLRSLSATSSNSATSAKSERRLSHRLHLRHSSRGSSRSSVHVPADLPDIAALTVTGEEDSQAEWEERATILARESNISHSPTRSWTTSTASNTNSRTLSASRPPGSPGKSSDTPSLHPPYLNTSSDSRAHDRRISDPQADDDIQLAITLHESGRLSESTAMFARLAQHSNNAMAQIMYGLALRHGWGVAPDPAQGLTYLSDAAAGAASVETAALQQGTKRGGPAKGELVLAIYELANSFRHGWGTPADPLAARSYYEVAANLGDLDAMNEIAQCYESGYGGKKDRFAAAQYYRRAERQGSKIVGNSWIWKDKYNPPAPATVARGQSGA